MASLKQVLQTPVAELRKILLQRKIVPPALIEALASDPREGARRLARILRSRRERDRCERLRLRRLFRFERELWTQGYRLVAGVDEAGMAPLAGPVVAGAVILPRGFQLPDLDDSKKILNGWKRMELAARIKRDAICWAVGSAKVEEIDRLNVYRAGLLAMQRAVGGLGVRPDYVLVDARTVPGCPAPQRGIIHGDALSATIAAASIVAKTTRDALMEEYDKIYPGYRLAAHKGYPTPEHCRLLKELGPLPIHRKSYARVREVLGLEPRQASLFPME
jgi:ribonuclease HII